MLHTPGLLDALWYAWAAVDEHAHVNAAVCAEAMHGTADRIAFKTVRAQVHAVCTSYWEDTECMHVAV